MHDLTYYFSFNKFVILKAYQVQTAQSHMLRKARWLIATSLFWFIRHFLDGSAEKRERSSK